MSIENGATAWNGIDIHRFSNGLVSISAAPALGGHIVSIRRAGGGREWLDGGQDQAEPRLWLPADPDDFSSGCGAGLDECLPTVLPCVVDGRTLPDHGELWNRPVAAQTIDDGCGFSCDWQLATLPLRFNRRVTLDGHRIRFDYRIENLADSATPFLWAWHPLFTLREGDRLEIAGDHRTCAGPDGSIHPWPEIQPGWDLASATLDPAGPSCAKVFLGPLETPCASITNQRDGEKLGIEWTGRWLPHAGVWITRGAWKSLHHWAIEPTNAPVDRLSDAIADPALEPLVTLAPFESRQWCILLSLETLNPDYQS